jgi:hypothetical protein
MAVIRYLFHVMSMERAFIFLDTFLIDVLLYLIVHKHVKTLKPLSSIHRTSVRLKTRRIAHHHTKYFIHFHFYFFSFDIRHTAAICLIYHRTPSLEKRPHIGLIDRRHFMTNISNSTHTL